MPLSSSDVEFLNKVLDKQVKAARNWPWLRWFIVAGGVVWVLAGFWSLRLTDDFHTMTASFLVHPSATRHAEPSTTLAVTPAQLETALESQDVKAQSHANLAAAMIMLYGMGIFSMLLGVSTICYAANHWNQFRRDAILIALLREKCAAELGAGGGGGN